MTRATTRHAAAIGLLIAISSACSGEAVPITSIDDPGPIALAITTRAFRALEPGEVQVIASFSAGKRPEGVTVDLRGNLYVGLRHHDPATNAFVHNDILHYDAAGQLVPIADLGAASPGAQGILGLATDIRGSVVAAFAAGSPAIRGIYKMAPDGSAVERLPGSENILFPNGLVFDSAGNLYATDSAAGAVWRCRPSELCEPWIQDVLLTPAAVPGFNVLPGANGIAYQPRYGIFVASTARGLIVRIPIEPGGAAGSLQVVVSGFIGIDGLTSRYRGPLYFVNAGANVLGIPAVYSVDPQTGVVTVLPGSLSAFDDPTTIAVSRGAVGPHSAFVVSADLFAPTGAGPGVLRLGLN